MVRKLHACIIILLLAVSLLLTANLLLIANISLTIMSEKPKIEYVTRIEYLNLEPIEFWGNSTTEVLSSSFYRFTEIIGTNYVGNTSFDADIYLVGASTIACSSKPQVYEITIRSGPMEPDIDITQPYDENGCAPFDWVSKIYFMLRINSTNGVSADRVFFPYGYGLFIPKGEFIHFNMGSQELSSGGSFTLYYLFQNAD